LIVDIYGIQVENKDKPSPYIETTSSSVTKTFTENPRIAYDHLTGKCKGVYIEDSSTNLLKYSEDFSQTVWVKSANGSGVAPVITSNFDIAPDGTKTATKVVFDQVKNDGSDDYSILFQAVSGSAGKYSGSIYVKAYDTPCYITIDCGGAKEHVYVPSEWTRISITSDLTTLIRLMIGLRENPYNNKATILIWGGQLEYKYYPTSYIRTTSAGVSRAIDSLTLPMGPVKDANVVREYSVNLVSSVDYITYGINRGGYGIDELYRFIRRVGYSTKYVSRYSGAEIYSYQACTTGEVKITHVVEPEIQKMYINDQFENSANSLSSTIGTPSVIHIGKGANGAEPIGGYVRKFQIFNYALTEAEVKQLKG
jgi:hypothetical protein